jgi:hypothetical protein
MGVGVSVLIRAVVFVPYPPPKKNTRIHIDIYIYI